MKKDWSLLLFVSFLILSKLNHTTVHLDVHVANEGDTSKGKAAGAFSAFVNR